MLTRDRTSSVTTKRACFRQAVLAILSLPRGGVTVTEDAPLVYPALATNNAYHKLPYTVSFRCNLPTRTRSSRIP